MWTPTKFNSDRMKSRGVASGSDGLEQVANYTVHMNSCAGGTVWSLRLKP